MAVRTLTRRKAPAEPWRQQAEAFIGIFAPDQKPYVEAVFLKAIWFAGTSPVHIVQTVRFFNTLTAEDRWILRHGGRCTPRLRLWAVLSNNVQRARAYARLLAERKPRGRRL